MPIGIRSTATMWQGGSDGNKTHSNSLMFRSAWYCYSYIKQSANATICTIIVNVIVGVLSAIFEGGILSTLLTIAANLYAVIIFIEILISAINLDKREIWGIYRFIK